MKKTLLAFAMASVFYLGLCASFSARTAAPTCGTSCGMQCGNVCVGTCYGCTEEQCDVVGRQCCDEAHAATGDTPPCEAQ